jgi:K+-transporting ATPase ATPase A chain
MLQGFFQIILTLLILVAIAPIFGRYIARVFLREKTLLEPIIMPVERAIYALAGIRAKEDMTGWQYAQALLYTNLVMGIFGYLLIMFQGVSTLKSY